jgi:hypothetical protein
MDSATLALHYLAAVEAAVYQSKRTDEVWTPGATCLGLGYKSKRPLVELRSLTYESGFSKAVL